MSIINQSVLNLDSIDVDSENFLIEGLTDDALIYYNEGLYSATIGSNLSFASGILATSLTPVFTNVTGTILTAAQPNITSLGTMSSNLNLGANNITNLNDISATSGIIGNLSTTNLSITNVLTNFNMSGFNITNVGTLAGTLTTASQPNITSLGTLTGLTMGGNLDMAGYSIVGYSPTITGNLDMATYNINNCGTLNVSNISAFTSNGIINLNNYKITNSSDSSLNTQYGTSALSSLTNGYDNCCFGYQSLNAMTSGFYNTAVGYQALKGVLNGYCNTAVGALAGLTVTTGINNVHIGYAADANNTNNSGQILIGYSATSAVDNVCKIMNVSSGKGCFINSINTGLASYLLYYNPITYEITCYSNDGWLDSTSETWTYVSADAPTFVFNVNAKVDTKYSAGMKIRYVQSSTTKYGIITKVGAFGSGVTPITIYGGGGDGGTYTNATSYTLANSAITSNYYSMIKAPLNFPLDPATWSYTLTNSVTYQTNSATYVEFNSALRVNVPIGCWKFKAHFLAAMYLDGWGGGGYWAVSTSTTAVSHMDLAIFRYEDNTNLHYSYETIDLATFLNFTSKTILYVIGHTSGVTYVYVINPTVFMSLKATCAYL